MRILKGQKILPDDSTLAQHNISDGDTVNIVIEPEKKIVLNVQFGPQIFPIFVSTSMSIKAVKQQLINNGTVVFNHCDFDLVYSQSPSSKVKLDDTLLPLHYYAIDGSAYISIEKTYLLVRIERVGQDGEWVKRMPKTASVGDLKKVILRGICDESVFGISVYLANSDKLEDDEILGELVKKEVDDFFYFVEDKCYNEYKEVYFKGNKVAKIGVDKNDSKRDLVFRAQDQLGIPFLMIEVRKPHPHHWDRSDSYIIEHG